MNERDVRCREVGWTITGATQCNGDPPDPKEELHNGSVIPLRISCFPRILYATTTPQPRLWSRLSPFPSGQSSSEQDPSWRPRLLCLAPETGSYGYTASASSYPFFWVLLELVDDGLGDVGGLGVAWKGGLLVRERCLGKGEGDVPPMSAVLTLPSFKTSYVAVAIALACFSRL
jgi:hypothetical protein